ncbi:hypothetical protein G3A_20260 [Bacillus sp. 17376]|nr:hypothetical protein G3A_20260 [Bacillus sp. 17376]
MKKRTLAGVLFLRYFIEYSPKVNQEENTGLFFPEKGKRV